MRAEKILKPSHSANMREFRPMPTTLKAMRHFENAGKRGGSILKVSHFLKSSHAVSHSQKTEDRHSAHVPIYLVSL